MTRGIDGGIETFTGALGGTLEQVHNAKLNIYGFTVVNNTNALAYVQLFDAAAVAGITLGTTVPDVVIPVPPNGQVSRELTMPISFGHGLVAASTTTRGGSTAAATDVMLDFWGA